VQDNVEPSIKRLTPLKYHNDLVAYLKREEGAVWAWSQSEEVRKQQADDMRQSMLLHTYRLEPESHPSVYAACKSAMDLLEIEAPVTLYQASDGMMNAALCFIPGEVHLVFYGPILDKLSPSELLALMGHELAHYKLWTAENGAFYNASRIIDHALSYAEVTPAHRETARLFSLYTEVYADRGAATVTEDPAPAISVLVKVMSGINSVDAAAYLRQAEELDTKVERSDGQSHPETFLRARALDLWWRDTPQVEDWIEIRLRGPLSVEALDLLRQDELTAMTRRFLVRALTEIGTTSEAVKTQVQGYFPDLKEDEESLDFSTLQGDAIDDATRNYFIALLFDCAMADSDMRDQVLLVAARIANELGAKELFAAALRRDLKWTKAATDRLLASAAKANKDGK
jgi:hypothetical protein